MSEEAPKEIAKAVQEAAKVSDTAMKLGDSYFGDAIKEFGRAFHDSAKAYRYKNLLKEVDKIQALHKERRIQGKPIPITPRYALPLIEAMSLEDDETLQDMWAALTANATDPKRQISINKILIDVLSKLEPLDAEILNQFEKLNFKAFMMHGRPLILVKFLIADLSKKIVASEKDIELSLQNLNRLGCIDIPKEATEDNAPDPFSIIEAPFNLTLIGSSLMEACKK